MEEAEYLNNLTKFYTLALLDQNPRHGYEIMDELEERTGKRPSTGQIYPLLKDFKQKGYVESAKKKVKGRKRKVYRLTEKGEEKFQKLAERFSDLISTILESQVTECEYCGCEIYNGGHNEVINGEELTFCCENCAKAYKEIELGDN